MKSTLLTAMIGLTGLGASGQMFGPALPPGTHLPPPAMRGPVFPGRPVTEIIKPSAEAAAAEALESRRRAAPGDRMLVRPDASYAGVAPARHEWQPIPDAVTETVEGVPDWREVFHGPWHAGVGIRFRVVFMNSRGVTWWQSGRFRMYRPGRGLVDVEAPEGTPLKESYGVFHAGDLVSYRVEVENVGHKPVGALVIRTRQLSMDYSGRKGEELKEGRKTLRIASGLQPGELTWRDGVFKMQNEGDAPINFQQTHVRITDGEGRALADVERAAVLDPPAGE